MVGKPIENRMRTTRNHTNEIIAFGLPQTQTRNVVLLHGLFGSLSNWQSVRSALEADYSIYIPQLPIHELSLTINRLDALVDFLEKYINDRQLDKVTLVGNSLGGHIALLYTLKFPRKVAKLILAGSSGLYENSFKGTFPRVRDYDYIADKVKDTFYNKDVVSDALVNEVFDIVQSKVKTLSIIAVARAAQKGNLSALLPTIEQPVLLVWGLQDEITPPSVALQFEKLLPNADLCLIDECGHVPMMEQPSLFNQHLLEFLQS